MQTMLIWIKKEFKWFYSKEKCPLKLNTSKKLSSKNICFLKSYHVKGFTKRIDVIPIGFSNPIGIIVLNLKCDFLKNRCD
jgi:hypothetical protein